MIFRDQSISQALAEIIGLLLFASLVTGVYCLIHTVKEKRKLEPPHNIFAGSKPLGNFETGVLNKTFDRALKDKPTLPNRK